MIGKSSRILKRKNSPSIEIFRLVYAGRKITNQPKGKNMKMTKFILGITAATIALSGTKAFASAELEAEIERLAGIVNGLECKTNNGIWDGKECVSKRDARKVKRAENNRKKALEKINDDVSKAFQRGLAACGSIGGEWDTDARQCND